MLRLRREDRIPTLRRTFAPFAMALALPARGASPAAPQAAPASVSPAAASPAEARIRADVAWLAAPGLKGRRAGSPEADRAADAIAERFRKLGLLPAGPKGSYQQRFDVGDGAPPVADVTQRRVRTANVLGLLPGTDPKTNSEIVIVAAHYDAPGSGGSPPLDREGDASGTAALLELARDFAERKPPLPRSLLFIAFGAEEIGTLGSIHFTKNPTAPWASVVAVFNVDRVGCLRDGVLDVRGVGTSPAWKGLVESSNAGAKLALSLLDLGFGPSDPSPFYAARKPVLFVGAGAPAGAREPPGGAGEADAAGIVRVVRFLEPVVAAVASAPERIAFSEVKGGVAPSAGGGRSFRVWVGGIPDFSEEGAGVKLSGVSAGSPAEKASLQAGDLIVKFGDKEPRNLYDYTYALQGRKPGEKVNIVVTRTEDGKTVEKTFEVTLGSRPDATK